MVSYFSHLLDIGKSVLKLKNVEQFLNLRENLLFSDAMKSSSCITTIIEVKSDEEILDVIDMVNDFKADRKHLTFIVQRLNQTIH